MPKVVLIGLLTAAVIAIVAGLKNPRGRYALPLAVAGVALLVLTVVGRLVLGG